MCNFHVKRSIGKILPENIIMNLYALVCLVCLFIGTPAAQANLLAWQAKTATPTKPPTFTKTPTPTFTPTATPTSTATPPLTITLLYTHQGSAKGELPPVGQTCNIWRGCQYPPRNKILLNSTVITFPRTGYYTVTTYGRVRSWGGGDSGLTGELERNFEPCTYSISGRLTDDEGQPVSGGVTFQVTDTLVLLALRNSRAKSSAPQHTLTLDENGYYVLDNFANGTYIIQPVANDAVFVPLQQTVKIEDNDVADVDFVRWTSYTITGQVTEATTNQPLDGVTIMADTDAPCYYPSASCYYYDRHGTTDGSYTITYVFREKSAYTLTPLHADYIFTPITRSVTVRGNVVGQDFTGYTRTYTVTGQVTDADSSENLDNVVVLADRGQSYTATIDATVLYTVANLLKDTYVFTARQPNYNFEPIEPDKRTLSVPDSLIGPTFYRKTLSAYTISGTVTFIRTGLPVPTVTIKVVGDKIYQATTNLTGTYLITDVSVGNYTISASKQENGQNYQFNASSIKIIVNKDIVQNFTTDTPPLLPKDPITTKGFKGANWLRLRRDATNATSNVGWNLDMAGDIMIANSTIYNLYYLHNVNTMIRLQSRPPFNAVQALTYNCYDSPMQEWMNSLDREYEAVMGDALIKQDLKSIPIFILGNEPNHSTDEWNYSAKAYARLYNCYYHRWRVIYHRDEALYVAGPGQVGPCDASGQCKNWEDFYKELLATDALAYADGFAIHAYGYFHTAMPGDNQTDANTEINQFTGWLHQAKVNILSRPDLKNRPVIVTENNPGARVPCPNCQVIYNQPANWQDWFDRTYCWVTQNSMNIRGLLYFVDETSQYRSSLSRDQWWPISLASAEARYQAWLDAPSATAPCTRSSLKNVTEDSLAQQMELRQVISGTLGQQRVETSYYVTEDVTVPAGQTLTLLPGTTLIFSPGKQMLIAGQLIAEGNRVYPIQFISTDPTGWAGLHFLPTAPGSRCIGCYLENLQVGATAMQVESPLTFRNGLIQDVPAGTAISTTVPFTLSNTVIDYVGTGIALAHQAKSTLTHLTLTRYQQGIVNQGAQLTIDNSIFSYGEVGFVTALTGTTTLRYSVLHQQTQEFSTTTGGQFIEGVSLLRASPGFVDFPNNMVLRYDSLAVDAADPQADYSQEPGYNGQRADAGAYGNTRWAPENPPYKQMAVSLKSVEPIQSGRAGQTVSYTVILKNEGKVANTYTVEAGRGQFLGSMYADGYYAPQYIELAPQSEISVTVWGRLPLWPSGQVIQTLWVGAAGRYGVYHHIELVGLIQAFQENGGQVIMEAENYDHQQEGQHQEKWSTEITLPDYSGTGYVSVLPDSGMLFTTAYTITSPELSYTINFSHTGFYYVWLRSYAPDKEGDSVYVALDDTPAQGVSGFTPKAWTWRNWSEELTRVAVWVKEPGLHTFNVWLKEDGLAIDRILLTQEITYRPTGFGPAAGSPTNLLTHLTQL